MSYEFLRAGNPGRLRDWPDMWSDRTTSLAVGPELRIKDCRSTSSGAHLPIVGGLRTWPKVASSPMITELPGLPTRVFIDHDYCGLRYQLGVALTDDALLA